MPEAPSELVTKPPTRPLGQVRADLRDHVHLWTPMTCFCFLENMVYFKGRNLQNRVTSGH